MEYFDVSEALWCKIYNSYWNTESWEWFLGLFDLEILVLKRNFEAYLLEAGNPHRVFQKKCMALSSGKTFILQVSKKDSLQTLQIKHFTKDLPQHSIISFCSRMTSKVTEDIVWQEVHFSCWGVFPLLITCGEKKPHHSLRQKACYS